MRTDYNESVFNALRCLAKEVRAEWESRQSEAGPTSLLLDQVRVALSFLQPGEADAEACIVLVETKVGLRSAKHAIGNSPAEALYLTHSLLHRLFRAKVMFAGVGIGVLRGNGTDNPQRKYSLAFPGKGKPPGPMGFPRKSLYLQPLARPWPGATKTLNKRHMDASADELQNMEVLASSDGYVLEYSPGLGLGRLEFRRKPSALEYQAAISRFCDQALRLGFRRMLFNNLEAGLISQEEKDWSRFYIENLLPKSALRKMASVTGENALQRMIISDMHQRGTHPYRLACFATEREALAWLLV